MLFAGRAHAQREAFPTVNPNPPAFTPLPTAPPAAPVAPYVAGPPSAATFNGNIQPAGPPMDPYATDPTLQAAPYQPGAVAQQATSGNGYLFTQPDGSTGEYPRFLQQVRLRYTYLQGSSSKPSDISMNMAEIDGTFVIPLWNQAAPLLVTPGFATDFTQGPDSSTGANLPPRLYDAYLDLGWRPHLTERFGLDLGFRAGVYSDFDFFNSRSIRYLGRAYGVYTYSPTLEIRLGAIYLDRVRTRWLPAGGIVWTPDVDTRWEVLFPDPKLAHRLTTFGNTDVWWYVAGEFGGDSWTVNREVVGHDAVEYSDLRVMLGLDWIGRLSVRGFTEIGYAFDRELDYRSGIGNIDPKPTLMLRGGITF